MKGTDNQCGKRFLCRHEYESVLKNRRFLRLKLPLLAARKAVFSVKKRRFALRKAWNYTRVRDKIHANSCNCLDSSICTGSASGLFSKKQYAANAEHRFMMKLYAFSYPELA